MKETLKRRGKALSLVLLVVLLTVTMLPTTAFAASKKVPSKVSVTKVSASTSSVKVSWKKAKDATSYRIYYRPSTTRKWTALTTVSSKTTSYTHKNSQKYPLKAGKKYYYTVRAYNKYSHKWGQYNTTGKAVTIPSVPGTVKISSVKAYGTNKVNIRWNKTSNATSYRIYYRPSTTRKWTAVKTVNSKTTSYTHVSSKLKAGKKYYYTVRAYNQNSKKWGRYDATGKSVTMQKPAPHVCSFDIIVSTNAGNCQTASSTVKKCSCGKTTTVNGDFGSHNMVHHDAQGHEVTDYEYHAICGGCGADFGSGEAGANAALDHTMKDFNDGCVNYSSKQVPVGSHWEEISPAYDECSICGKR